MDEINAPRPVLRLALPGIPAACGYCGETVSEWPLTVVGHLVKVTCPECWQVVAPVVAVAADVQDEIKALREQIAVISAALDAHAFEPHEGAHTY